jgi:hypothetical protein
MPSARHLNHAGHGIRSEERGVRAPRFDMVDVFGRRPAEIEKPAGVIEGHAIEQHVVVAALTAANEKRREA